MVTSDTWWWIFLALVGTSVLWKTYMFGFEQGQAYSREEDDAT